MFSDFRNALAFLTILPVGYDDQAQPGPSFAFYPVVGLVIGLLIGGTYLLAQQAFSTSMTDFLVLLLWVVISGGLHLDGFGDACDGLFATVSPERRLEIMKDSRAGSWAVIGLILLLLGKWVALQGVSPLLLVLPPVLGRWAIVMVVAAFPYGRAEGVGAFFRMGFERRHLMIATAATGVLVVAVSVVAGYRLLIFLLLVPGVAWIVGRWAAKRLGGGLTGDVYGALCELTELMVLLVLHL